MYTISVGILFFIAVCMLIYDTQRFKKKYFAYWVICSCSYGWTEFITMLRFDIPAWFFNQSHVVGFKILNVEIEDYFFCISFSVIFYWLYEFFKPKFKTKVYNSDAKIIIMIILCIITIFYFNLLSPFSIYLTTKMLIGLIFVISLYNAISFRLFLTIAGLICAIGFVWDITAINLDNWFYVDNLGKMSHVYCQIIYKVFNAVFPIEIFFYYISGGVFCFGTLAFLDHYFQEQKRLF